MISGLRPLFALLAIYSGLISVDNTALAMSLEIGSRIAHYDVTARIGDADEGGHVIVRQPGADFQSHTLVVR